MQGNLEGESGNLSEGTPSFAIPLHPPNKKTDKPGCL